jgi:gamma-glutamyltranspeptidase / glutathione hydrolase
MDPRMFRLLTAALILTTCRWSIPCADAQQKVVANRYVVASGHPAATAVGMEVLRRGGNVIDATIATSLALGVAEPYASGLGGKLVLLYREAATGKVYSIVALCTSPAALNEREFCQLSSDERQCGYHSVGIPGLVAGLDEAHRRWGSLQWADLVRPAADLAENGVEIDETMRSMFQPKVRYLRRNDEAAQLYLVDGKAPPVGTIMRNADLAETLREIAASGARTFYEGPIADRVVEAAQRAGAPLSKEDFQNYRVEVAQPLEIEYRGYHVYSCPPPLTGGVTVLSVLECLEQMKPEVSSGDQIAFSDRMCRALECLYPRIDDSIADLSQSRKSAEILMDDACARYLAGVASRLDPRHPYGNSEKSRNAEPSVEGLSSASTSHLLVVDRAGNMVSMTQSLSLHFGASVVAPGTGFLLNDSLSNFSTSDPHVANYAAGAKRARSTIAPIIVTKEGQPWLALGIPGGQRIPTTTLQLLWRLIDGKTPLDEAFAAPRFHLRRPLRDDEPPNVIDYEEDASQKWAEQLASRGWSLAPQPHDGRYFGGGSAAQYRDDGTIVGVADLRRTNFAAGD